MEPLAVKIIWSKFDEVKVVFRKLRVYIFMKTCKIHVFLQFLKSMARNQTDFKVVQILVTFKMLRFCVPFACGPVGRCVLTVGSRQLMGREVVWLGMEVQPRREVIYMWNFNVMIPWTEKLDGLQSTGSQSRTRLSD